MKELWEGDPKGWHIRLHLKMGDTEAWCLYYGETQKSSPMPKQFVEKWMNDEREALQRDRDNDDNL